MNRSIKQKNNSDMMQSMPQALIDWVDLFSPVYIGNFKREEASLEK